MQGATWWAAALLLAGCASEEADSGQASPLPDVCVFACGPDVAGGPAADADPDAAPVDLDSDGDGIPDDVDNCETARNPDQANLDGDRFGDVCDADIDDDRFTNDLDCAPRDDQVYPGANERCANHIDDDCDGATDEEGAWDCSDYFTDGDGDGAGAPASLRCLCVPEGDHQVEVGGDCAPEDATTSPFATERCDDLDNNCNGLIDEGCDDDADGYCDDDLIVSVPWPAACAQGPGDCYDYSDLISPSAPEILGDGFDNDCDGEIDNEGSTEPIDCTCDTSCTGETPDDFVCAIDMCCWETLVWTTVGSPTGDTIDGAWGALARWGPLTNGLAPFKGNSYGILGSGAYADLTHESRLEGETPGIDPFSNDEDMHDVVELKMHLLAPPTAKAFSVDYIFMSAEYLEWVGTVFNDKFYIVLEAASTNDGQPTVINYAPCLNANAYYDLVVGGDKMCFIAINATFHEPCACDSPASFDGCSNALFPWSCVESAALGDVCWPVGATSPPPLTTVDLSGTGHECANGGSSTGWLTTAWPIDAGEAFTLTFHIHDTGDELLDSQVLIDNFQWLRKHVTGFTASKN